MAVSRDRVSSESSSSPIDFGRVGPGHFMEVSKILPLLTASSEKHPSFHVVAFSLPGYGFSEAPKKKGFSVAQFAEVSRLLLAPRVDFRAYDPDQVGHKLMLALGYEQYGT